MEIRQVPQPSDRFRLIQGEEMFEMFGKFRREMSTLWASSIPISFSFPSPDKISVMETTWPTDVIMKFSIGLRGELGVSGGKWGCGIG